MPEKVQADLYRGLGPVEIAQLERVVRLHILNAGAVVVIEGAHDQSMFLIRKGVVEVFKGEEKVTERAAGQLIGEVNFVLGTERTATVKAKTDVEIVEFPWEALWELFGENPQLSAQFAWNIATILATRFCEATVQVWDARSEHRLAMASLSRLQTRVSRGSEG